MAFGAIGTGEEGEGTVETRSESIDALRAYEEGDAIAVRTDAGPIDGRVGTIDDRGEEYLLFVQPSDLQQVRQYTDVVSLEEVLLAIFAKSEGEEGWSVSTSLVVKTATGSQWQTDLGQVRGTGDGHDPAAPER
ncbi:hypothetical protein BRC77_06885 [Halobacteriales archaeon QH_8_64_26]|nr:MAG: hypothetical protein BRC77_06885 [Halobacteriales archaeon QH_8_64_26]